MIAPDAREIDEAENAVAWYVWSLQTRGYTRDEAGGEARRLLAEIIEMFNRRTTFVPRVVES